MILLDTSAVLFLLAGHRRQAGLSPYAGHLAFSPIALLEMHFLAEAGRLVFAAPDPGAAVRQDPRWTIDDPPLDGLVDRAAALRWTRDPFDRLLAAHALFRRWRLATSDRVLLKNLPTSSTLAL